MSGRLRVGSAENRSQRATTRRVLARVIAGFVLLAAQTGPLASGVLGVGPQPTGAPETHGTDGTKASSGGPVAPIDYKFPPGGGSAGSPLGNDPSVGLRPTIEPAARPKVKTAVGDAWTSDQRVWENPDGTYTLEAGPRLNFKATDGAWTAYNFALKDDGKGALKASASPIDVAFFAGAADGTMASIKGGDGTLSIRLPDPAAGSKTDETLTFAPVSGEPAPFVRATEDGFEFGATYPDAATSPAVTFVLDPGGLVPVVAKDGLSIELRIADGDPALVGLISAPAFTDEAAGEAQPADKTVGLVDAGDGTYRLTYSISTEWLAAN